MAALPLFTSRRALSCIASLLLTCVLAADAVADDPRVILDAKNLKPSARKALEQVSGRVGGERLEMTGMEVWNIRRKYADQFQHVAAEQGVKLDVLGPSFNRILSLAPAGSSLTGREQRLLDLHKRDTSPGRVMLMTSPSVPRVEYALGQGLKPPVMTETVPTPADIQVQQTRSEISIQISENRTITIQRTNMEPTKEGCVWTGLVKGTGEPVTLMWWGSGRMAATFSIGRMSYEIRNLGGQKHALIETDIRRLPADHMIGAPRAQSARARDVIRQGDASMMRRAAADAKATAPNPATRREPRVQVGRGSSSGSSLRPPEDRPAHRVDVLVAYTKNAAAHFDDIHKDLATLAVEQTNHTFRRSGVTSVEINLVGTVQVDYDEADASHFDHVWRFADRRDGYMDTIHKLRDDTKADIAILIVDDEKGCGLATRVAGEADEAFAVVHHDCALKSFSFAHEIGHIFGARHDRALDQSTRPFPYGHAFVRGTKWRTIMAYRNSCGDCPREPVWSSPKVTVRGEAAGDNTTRNAQVISERAATIAGFR